VNVIQKGKNYGWPVVSYGINYDGKTISKAPAKEGVTLPQHQYTPSIGTCGIAFLTSDKYKGWKGSLFVGGLAYQYLSRLEIKDGKVVKEHKLLESIGRVRNVKQGLMA
jgi:glucose/arabinose dehydrogenase